MTATRRLAAILAADVAGYSRLMGGDEEGTHERLRAHHRELVEPKIRGHSGRIVKTTGDGLLVEFPSVIDAVRCAAELQRAIIDREAGVPEDRRIRFRVGINLGDVIVEDGDIFGDGVNVAARLETLSEPGGLCISRMARDQIRDKLAYAFEDMGEPDARGAAQFAAPARQDLDLCHARPDRGSGPVGPHAVLSHGQIEQIGTPAEIYERPASAFVAEFIGSSNMLRGRIVERAEAGTIVATETGLRLCCRPEPEGEVDTPEVSILLRPERIHIEAPGGCAMPGQNRVSACIADVTYLGEDLHLSLDLAGGERLRASVKNANAARGWAPTQSVELVVDAADLRLLSR